MTILVMFTPINALAVSNDPTYYVRYDGNGNTGGFAPTTQSFTSGDVTIKDKDEALVRTGYSFTGWNTAEDGSGNAYAAGSTYNTLADVTLYAQWTLTAIIVGPEYGNKTITAALANASDGDTIIVKDGTYTENVEVLHNKNNIIIRSENGAENTLIRAKDPSKNAFYINAHNVTIEGFNITGAKSPDSIMMVAGIFLAESDNCTISNNILTGNSNGIMLLGSNYTELTENNATYNDFGFVLFGLSNYNTLTNNKASDNMVGIHIYVSSNNILTGNNMLSNRYNFHVDAYSLREYTHNIDTSNLVDNKPVYYLVDRSDERIPSNAGLVYAINSSNVTVNEINIHNETMGIVFYETRNSTIKNSMVSDCAEGIFLKNSSNNTLTGNNASDNTNGICMDESSNNNTLTGNIANNNNQSGIYLPYSRDNTLKSNNASDNTFGVYINEPSNNNNLTDNIMNNNKEYGLYLHYSSNNSLTGNTANDNMRGFYIDESDNTILTGNKANDNTYGIYINESNNNILTGNKANDNSFGICIYESSNNTLAENTMSANTFNFYMNADSLSDYAHDINTSNLVDNKPVYYILNSSDVTIPSSAGVVYAINSSKITVNGVKISNEYYGIHFYKTSNSTIKNGRVSDCCEGIFLDNYSNNNALTYNIVNNNERYGLYLRESSNNTLTGNTATGNKDVGIPLFKSSNNTLTGNTATGNGDGGEEDVGISLSKGSDNNILTGNTANNNNRYGFTVRESDNNTLTRNIANSNIHNGISLLLATDNVMISNTAVGNAMNDIAVVYTSGSEIKNTKVTQSGALVSFLADMSQIGIKGDTTNSTPLAGKVNVNGYLTLVRTGLVEPAGIGPNMKIEKLNITVSYDDAGMSSSGESSIDLYKYNQTVNGTTWTVVNGTSLNTSLNQVNATILEGKFALFKDPEPTSSDDGVRVSLGQGQSPEIVKSYATSMMRVIGGSPVEYDFSGSDTPVLGISFDAKQDKGLVVAKVQVLSSAPEGVPAPSGNAYQIMSIDVGSEGTISSDSADDVMIHFKVSKKWIEENNIDISTIRMSRYHGEQWNDLPTTKENEDDEYFYFYAETPGFSVFEIVGDEIGETPEQVPVASPTTEDEEPEEDTENSIPGFTALAGIVLVSLAVLVRRK